MNPHYDALSKVIVNHSIEVTKGDRVLIDAIDIPDAMVLSLMRTIKKAGGYPFVRTIHPRISKEFILSLSEKEMIEYGKIDLKFVQQMQCYVAFRGSENIFESSDVPPETTKAYSAAMKKSLDFRVNKTRWVITRWPNGSMAQLAMMSTEKFEELFFKVMTLDYSRMDAGMESLKDLMESTDKVHIQGPGTDLQFSIKGIPAKTCGGKRNLPDGEVFTAPVKLSVEGEITYNAPTVYNGIGYDQIYLKFKKGKIVDAKSNNTAALNKVLDTDEGARYIGEFAIAFNPHILEPIRDILFDEKIAGSFHFTPGDSYEDAGNGNKSKIHWDMVSIQRPEYGGGTIAFDGKIIRKDGIFVTKPLMKLNPDYLLSKSKQ